MEEEIKISERLKARYAFRGVLLRFLEGYLIWEEWNELISTEELKELTKPLVEFEQTLEKRYKEKNFMDSEKFYNDPLIKALDKMYTNKDSILEQKRKELEALINPPEPTDPKTIEALDKLRHLKEEAEEEYVKGKTIDQFFEKALAVANSGEMTKNDFIKILYVLSNNFEPSQSYFNSDNQLVVKELSEEGKRKFEEGKAKLMEAFDKQNLLSMAIGIQ